MIIGVTDLRATFREASRRALPLIGVTEPHAPTLWQASGFWATGRVVHGYGSFLVSFVSPFGVFGVSGARLAKEPADGLELLTGSTAQPE